MSDSPSLYRQIRDSWSGKVPDTALFLRFVVRPVSHALTVPFAALGVCPNTVTLLGGLLATAAAVCFWHTPEGLWPVGVALYMAYVALDYVDGNLSRHQDRATYLGKYLDGLIDLWASSCFLILGGLGIARMSDGWPWLLPLALGTAALQLFAVGAMARLSFFQRWILTEMATGSNHKLDEAGTAAELSETLQRKPAVFSTSAYRIFAALSLDWQMIGLLATLAFEIQALYLAVLCGLLCANNLLVIALNLSTAWKTINLPRVSQNAVSPATDQTTR